MKSGIYVIANNAANKFYIGSAVNFQIRWNRHIACLRACKHPNKHLQGAYNIYGEDCFKFIILEYCEKDKLLEREQFWIDNTSAVELGYNLAPTAGSTLGKRHSEEFKRKRSEAYKGRKHTEEEKLKIGLALKGRKQSQTAITNMKLAKLNQSQETKDKIGLAHKGKIISESHKKIVSEAAKRLAIKRKADMMIELVLSLKDEIEWEKKPG